MTVALHVVRAVLLGANAAPADGSDKPAAAAGADDKSTVKRVRKVGAPAAAADGAKAE